MKAPAYQFSQEAFNDPGAEAVEMRPLLLELAAATLKRTYDQRAADLPAYRAVRQLDAPAQARLAVATGLALHHEYERAGHLACPEWQLSIALGDVLESLLRTALPLGEEDYLRILRGPVATAERPPAALFATADWPGQAGQKAGPLSARADGNPGPAGQCICRTPGPAARHPGRRRRKLNRAAHLQPLRRAGPTPECLGGGPNFRPGCQLAAPAATYLDKPTLPMARGLLWSLRPVLDAGLLTLVVELLPHCYQLLPKSPAPWASRPTR